MTFLFPNPFPNPSSKDRDSGFDAVLETLDLPPNAKCLDIGSGGFCGRTTTQYLLKRYALPIRAIELNSERAKALSEAFGNSVDVVVGDAFQEDLGNPDIIVSDLDASLIPAQIERLLPRVKSALVPGTHFITLFIYDCSAVFDREQPLLNRTLRDRTEKLISDVGGKSGTCTNKQIAPYFSRQGFTVLGIVNKWLSSEDKRGIGWLVLQKN